MTPHRCPVCLGRGFVPAGFYRPGENPIASFLDDEPCRTCDKGVIWELEKQDEVEK